MAHQAIEQDEVVSSQNIQWQRYLQVEEELQDKTNQCEQLENENDTLKKINKQLAEKNSQLYKKKNGISPEKDLSKPNEVSVEDIHDSTKDEDTDSQTWRNTSEQKEQVMAEGELNSLQMPFEQLEIEPWKIKYLEKEDEFNELKAKCYVIAKYNLDLSEKNKALEERNKELEERNKELEEDNEDGPRQVEVKYAKRAEKMENVTGNNARAVMFPSVFQSDSGPNISYVDPNNCLASCVLSVIFFVFNEMKLKICFRRFVVEMRDKLSELPGAKFEVGKCSSSLEDLYHLCIIEKKTVFSKEKINGIDDIHHALQEAIGQMKEQGINSALLVVLYETRHPHCMAIMQKTDDSNPTVLMEIYDVQIDQRWPQCDKHVRSIKQIQVYKVDKDVAKEWERTCGRRKICEAECKVCIPVKEVGITANPVLDVDEL